MAGPVGSPLEPLLKLAQIEPFHIGPDHPCRMVLSDQALDIHGPQFDLIPLRLPQTRDTEPRRLSRAPGFWKLPEQFMFRHPRPPYDSLIARNHRRTARGYRYLS